ncbi:acyltransferase [Acinetobacter oleivorans]|uniref:acyltransferase n=1 Tax=Acinetobacter oleivorans TaxID=1148157 RepID=UPI00177DBD9E|nr:acyltransferase [Acinetobacter oleivorans]
MIGKFVRFCIRLLNNMLYGHAYAGSIQPKVNGWCVFKGRISFGKNSHFNGAKLYGQGGISIGDNFHSAAGLTILTQNHNWKGTKLPYDETILYRPVTIGDNVWIGLNVTILPGVTIGEGCIIQAGAVVSKSIPDLAIAGGNPATVIKYRDSEHYFQLKTNEKFH